MSQHRSLKSSGKIRKKRNVLKRFERIDILREDGRHSDGSRVWGLPKTKVRHSKAGSKAKKAAEEAAPAAGEAGAAKAEAPAAPAAKGAAPAKGKK